MIETLLLNTLAILAISGTAIAATETELTLNAGNIETGRMMYVNMGCASCHGNDAYGTEMDLGTGFPALRGLDKDYIIKQLEDFQSGERQDPTMNAMAPMVEGYEIDIAEYLSSLSTEDTVELEVTAQIN